MILLAACAGIDTVASTLRLFPPLVESTPFHRSCPIIFVQSMFVLNRGTWRNRNSDRSEPKGGYWITRFASTVSDLPKAESG